MQIVADESLDFNIVQALRDTGFEVWAVVEPAFKIPLVLNALQNHISEIATNFAVLNERRLRIRHLNR